MAANDAVIRIVQSLKEVDPAQWNACAQPPGEPTNPFLSHEFLSALETILKRNFGGQPRPTSQRTQIRKCAS